MTPVAVADIINRVKILLDENETSNPTEIVTDVNQLQYDDIIRNCIPDAVRMIHEAADSSLLDGMAIPGTPIYSYKKGVLELPPDFMRLVIFQLNTWSRPVTKAISDTSPEYFMQGSKYDGIRGGVDKPVCAISSGSEGKVLEIFSASKDSGDGTPSKASYLPIPTIETTTGIKPVDVIKICAKLVQPAIYQTAALVCVATQDARAQAYFDLAKSFVN